MPPARRPSGSSRKPTTRKSPPKKPAPYEHTFLEKWWPWIVRFAGLSIILWQTVVENADRPSLLLLAAGMLGLPEFVKLDRLRHPAQKTK